MQSTQQKLSFSKQERIKSKKRIEEIFEKGKKLKQFPFKLNYIEINDTQPYPAQIVVSVPKKIVKLATKRNRLKRQIKEIYRLYKPQLYQTLNQKNKKVALFLIYIGKEKEEYHFLEKKLILLLKKLQEQL